VRYGAEISESGYGIVNLATTEIDCSTVSLMDGVSQNTIR
jgi:hypothetical protein